MSGADEIREAAENGDMEEAARLQLLYLECGTPILTAYLMIRAVQPVLPVELQRLLDERLADTGVAVAALDVLR